MKNESTIVSIFQVSNDDVTLHNSINEMTNNMNMPNKLKRRRKSCFVKMQSRPIETSDGVIIEEDDSHLKRTFFTSQTEANLDIGKC